MLNKVPAILKSAFLEIPKDFKSKTIVWKCLTQEIARKKVEPIFEDECTIMRATLQLPVKHKD